MLNKLYLNKHSLKSNIKRMLIFGLISALFANLKFSIPGLEQGTSDAREITALISVAFLSHWIYAVGVGIIASFGAYNNLITTILMHVTTIPLAWIFLNYISQRTEKNIIIGISWGIMVALLSLTIFPWVYIFSNYILGNIVFHQFLDTYFLFVKGTQFEIFINIVLTSFIIISVFLFRETKKKSTYLKLIEENTELGLWDWDILNNKINYNEQWAKMVDFQLDEVNNKLNIWPELLHPDDYATVQKKLNDNLTGKSDFYKAEYRMRSKRGKYIWIHDRGRVLSRNEKGEALRMIGIHLDMSKQKEMLEKIKSLQNYLSNIINSMPSVIIGVDPDGKITQWNNKAESVTGISNQNAAGKKLIELIPYLEPEIAKIQTSIKTGQILTTTKKTRFIENEVCYEDITIYPLVTDGTSGAVIRIDDVTEKVKLDELIIQSEKMLSVGGLAAGMAHEINNPLAGIIQNIQVIENRLFNNLPANRKYADELGISIDIIKKYMINRKIDIMFAHIKESGKRAAEIVSNMLSFSRKEASLTSKSSVSELLDKAIDLARNDYNLKKQYDFRKIKIIKNYAPAIPEIHCESTKIQQVFFNIIKNGAEAMQEVKSNNYEPRLKFTIENKNNNVRIVIEDNGPGMEKETMNHVFEPFYTTKNVGSGTGLGMSVSYFIVTEIHGGTLTVQSKKDKWTRFIIELPIEKENMA